jgi:uncharacterized membrane protein
MIVPRIWFGLFGLRLLLMVVIWSGLSFSAVWAVRYIIRKDHSDAQNGERRDARDLLDQRYVRGEITREQYELIKRDITIP